MTRPLKRSLQQQKSALFGKRNQLQNDSANCWTNFKLFFQMSNKSRNFTGLIFLGVVALVLLGRYLYMQPAQSEGDGLPSFEATRLDGQPFSLQALRGRYVLLDFWGSWCAPCRRQNPELVALYRQYGQSRFTDAQGFTIVSIGIEEDQDRWRRAIERDGLAWPDHILDLSSSLRFFNSPLAKRYNIRQVPTTYLLGPKGNIIAINLPPAQVDLYLKTKLTN
jgi:thiol-disulfide isomerase/thioredoxin